MKTVSFKIDEEELELLERFCMKENVPRSVVIRNLIASFLKEQMKDEIIPRAKVIKTSI